MVFMAGLSLVLKSAGLHFIIAGLAGTLFYLGMLLLLKETSVQELTTLHR
jgi:putative flippase GtrA